jgi:hypothetical protein
MGILDSLSKAAKTFIDDINTPESFKKGEKFENFTREVIFPQSKYKLLKQTHNYAQNSKDYVEESLEPDFEFQHIETNQKFYVEAKFRSEVHDGGIKFSYPKQFERYKEIGKTSTVFIIIGMGDEPSNPDHVCLIPLNSVNDIYLSESFLEKYTIANNRPIAISKLEELVKSPNIKNTNIRNSASKNTGISVEKSNFKKANAGYCIRCHKSIPFDPDRPLCKECYSEWAEYENEDYEEDYCHYCGKESDVNFAKPICFSCYKKLS